ncbi:MAG: aldo/keto reductase [Paracoccus sp. (in: a-proteobacteria)]|uniref:aldo/keto reductase n=1 Tax=Paracoccus sp. TaxID=267 RepID=UPI0026E0C0B8|nr:aldo/keto reductase [Paracoccus sp. (in: a-proteobacteria)]MDO5632641.1 aldo/keto reductase [Paracoccus sp. (in: a-proteobacteria)]
MMNVNAHGAVIPALGFGVFRMSEAEVETLIPAALETGFRHFDTAQIYENEAALGRALTAAGARRDDLFLTTKVWVSNYSADRFAASVDESLDRLGVDHVDLLLAHWPGDAVPVERQIEWLNEVQAAGKTRHIGVSNYNRSQLKAAIAASATPIITNQIEMHPYLDQSAMIALAADTGTALTAYYGMADGAVPRDAVLAEIGAGHGKTAAQVALRWLVQQGIIALSKTANPARLAENFAIFDFALSGAEMARITALSRADGRLVSPAGLAPDWAA